MKINKTIQFLLATLLISVGCMGPVSAETIIGIFDSGVDPDHKDLEFKIKRNTLESRNQQDDDHNNAIDDLYGWNLLDENDHIFKHELRGTFPPNIYKYYKVKTKKTLGTISTQDLDWYNNIRKDEEFMKVLKSFKSFIHGTHIAGIATNTEGVYSYLKLKYYPIKYLGKAESNRWKEPEFSPLKKGTKLQRYKHIKAFFSKYCKWQKSKWVRAMQLTHAKTDIINGSFGKSYKSVLTLVADKYKLEFDVEPSEDKKQDLALDFTKKLMKITTEIASDHKNKLFVFSAGNSKDDNDLKPHYPSNARWPNIISVGASKQHSEKAYFSNYGKNSVDIFAPGLAISSTIPTDQYIRVNGTSQAAPFISNVAAKALEISRMRKIHLTMAKLKTIILGTVDKKTELIDQSVSGGIVNPERVYAAVKLLKKYNITTAIQKALKLVSPINTLDSLNKEDISESLSLPLPEPF